MSHEEVYLAVVAFTLLNTDSPKFGNKGSDEAAEVNELEHGPGIPSRLGMNLKAGRKVVEPNGERALTGNPGETLPAGALDEPGEEGDFACVID